MLALMSVSLCFSMKIIKYIDYFLRNGIGGVARSRVMRVTKKMFPGSRREDGRGTAGNREKCCVAVRHRKLPAFSFRDQWSGLTPFRSHADHRTCWLRARCPVT